MLIFLYCIDLILFCFPKSILLFRKQMDVLWLLVDFNLIFVTSSISHALLVQISKEESRVKVGTEERPKVHG